MEKLALTSALLDWYRTVRRDLPWRKSQDPYPIWISEVMLQQTRVETVIPYFDRFMKQYPTVDALAAAQEEDVLKYWEGLGYYSRVRNLHAAVREVAAKYGGEIPRTYEEMRALPGVGPYTVGAVLSIAYGLPIPAVDGNVLRVIARLFVLEEDIAHARTRSKVEIIVSELIPSEFAGDFNQALMELGATVCIPRTPKCTECPLAVGCAAYSSGRQSELPYKKSKKPPRIEERVVFLVRNAKGDVLIRKRPDKGLLSGLWELPHFSAPTEGVFQLTESHLTSERSGEVWAVAHELLSDAPRQISFVRNYTHVFSHVIWKLTLFVVEGRGTFIPQSPYTWMSASQREQYTFGQVFNKIFADLD